MTISEKLTSIAITTRRRNSAIAQKLLAKIDLKLAYVGRLGKRENRECVYRFVAPDDERDSIFRQWLNWDELFQNELVSVSNNIVLNTPVTDTTPIDIPQTVTQVENPVAQGWKGLKLKMQQGLDSAGSFYQELVSRVGSSVGVADGEPYWNGCLGRLLTLCIFRGFSGKLFVLFLFDLKCLLQAL